MQCATDPWEVIGYEVKMFNATYGRLLNSPGFARLPYVLKNAIEESAVLHTRILCDVFLCRTNKRDDIQLSKLFVGWPTDTRYYALKALITKLDQQYGTRSKPGSPCWVFNKMLAHPTFHRDTEYD